MTPQAYTIMRLSQAPDLDALKRVWDSLTPERRAEPEIREYKDRAKALFEAEGK